MKSQVCGFIPVAAALLITSTIMHSPSASADIMIDDFTSVGSPLQWPFSQTSIGNHLVTEVGLGDVLGGVRQTTVFGNSFASGSDAVTVDVDTTGIGTMNYTSTSGGDGALTLFYTGFPSGLNLDLTDELGLQIDFDDYFFGDPGRLSSGTNITMALNDGSVDAVQSQFLGGSGPQSIFFDINLFTGIDSFDVTNVNRITISIDTFANENFSIDSIYTQTVPGPGALCLLGLAGLSSRRRRRRA